MKNAVAIFERYEEIHPRLPAATFPGQTQNIPSLMDIVPEVDAFVFDAFGVLNIGESLIPGADRRLQDLRRAGCHIRILTNAASYTKPGAIAKFKRLGLTLEDSEIITSRDAALEHVDARHWGVIAMPSDRLEDVGGCLTRLGNEAGAFDAVDGFLFLSAAEWSDARHGVLQASLIRNPRPVIIANADLAAPRENGFSLEPGYYGHRLADQTRADIQFFGKPFPDVYARVTDTLPGIPPDRIAMCGDTLHTDILGAAVQGWRTVFVTQDGLFAGLDAAEYVERSGIRPDWQLRRI